MPVCCDCKRDLRRKDFTKAQLKKGSDNRQCIGCSQNTEGRSSSNSDDVERQIAEMALAEEQPKGQFGEESLTARVSRQRMEECCVVCHEKLPPLSERPKKTVSLCCCLKLVHDECQSNMEKRNGRFLCPLCRDPGQSPREDLLNGAQRGNGWAQVQEGARCKEVEGDIEQAKYWFEKAADQGYAEGAHSLGQ